MLKRDKKDKDEKKKEKEQEKDELGLAELGLVSEGDEDIIDVERAGRGGNRGHMDQVGRGEVLDLYGSIQEYLRANHGPGEYRVTVSKKGKKSAHRVRIADEGGGPGGDQPPGRLGEGDMPMPTDPAGMATVMHLQNEIARLQMEKEFASGADKTDMLDSVMRFVEPMMTAFLGSMQHKSEVAEVIQSATASIRELSEVRNNLVAPGKSGDMDIASLIGGIASAFQRNQAGQATPAPMPNLVSEPAPSLPMTPAPPPVVEQTPQAPLNNQAQAPQETPPADLLTGGPATALIDSKLDTTIETLMHMISQSQAPEVVADELIRNLNGINDEEIQKLTAEQPQLSAILVQLRQNPVLAWDWAIQTEPSLAQDKEYSGEIRAVLQQRMTA